MKKKGREVEKFKVIDLRNCKAYIHETISKNCKVINKEGVTIKRYQLHPKYGKGCINQFSTQEISITISRYKLNKDLIYYQLLKKECVQIHFILTGEKVIYLKYFKDLFLENWDSFMTHIQNYDGRIKIFGDKMFTEIKIQIPLSFLINHGLVNDYKLKTLYDDNLILPITDELFSILENLERKDILEIANEMYLNAKALEIMALQLEQYKNKMNRVKSGNDKTLKMLYQTRKLIKSNLHRNLSLMELAIEVGVNSNTLNKEFIRVFGYSVSEFSILEKMNHAKYMLENTQKMIYQIAEEIGYKNATHFTAAFKRSFNITPKQFRQQL